MIEIRKTIYDGDGMPMNFIEALQWLRDKMSEIPHDMREKATIEFVPVWDGESVSVEIKGVRDETEEERIEREAKGFALQRRVAELREAQRRATYEELKRIYGDV